MQINVLEPYYFLIAKFLLNAHTVGHQPQKYESENLQFRTNLPD